MVTATDCFPAATTSGRTGRNPLHILSLAAAPGANGDCLFLSRVISSRQISHSAAAAARNKCPVLSSLGHRSSTCRLLVRGIGLAATLILEETSGDRAMIYLISYRKKPVASQLHITLRKKFFAAHPENPSREDIERLVRRVSDGDFAEASIEFEKCVGFDADELSRCGVTVYRLDGEPSPRALTSL
jgi:hypothetical protein